MTISAEFKQIIDDDIEKCSTEIESGNKKSRRELHNRLITKYGKIIDGFNDNMPTLFYDESGIQCTTNLKTMQEKLLLFKAMGYTNAYATDTSGITIHNSNQQSNPITITFDEVRQKVDDMGSLTENEIEEIHQKIKILEEIISSSERKTKKWEKAKDIIKWVADKGVDVGIAILPLLLQIG